MLILVGSDIVIKLVSVKRTCNGFLIKEWSHLSAQELN